MAYMEFEDSPQGRSDRKAFWTGEDGRTLVRQWRREGASLERIAAHIGVATSTLDKWRMQSPELEAAIKDTDELVNAMVENALLKRALGYDKVDVTEELVEGEMREVKRVTTPVPPELAVLAPVRPLARPAGPAGRHRRGGRAGQGGAGHHRQGGGRGPAGHRLDVEVFEPWNLRSS